MLQGSKILLPKKSLKKRNARARRLAYQKIAMIRRIKKLSGLDRAS